VVNQSIAATETHSPLLRRRAREERPRIAEVADRYAQRHAVVPALYEEPVGMERLLKLLDPMPSRPELATGSD
jgi:arsenite-transporting ATPase